MWNNIVKIGILFFLLYKNTYTQVHEHTNHPSTTHTRIHTHRHSIYKIKKERGREMGNRNAAPQRERVDDKWYKFLCLRNAQKIHKIYI